MLPIIGRTSVAVLRDSHILMKTERKVITLRQGDAVVGIKLSIEIVLIDITYKPAALKEVTVVFVVGIIEYCVLSKAKFPYSEAYSVLPFIILSHCLLASILVRSIHVRFGVILLMLAVMYFPMFSLSLPLDEDPFATASGSR